MNTVGIFKDAVMYARGFKKVALKDTKGVLTEVNNHKWIKNYTKDNLNITTQILPSGTVVQDIAEKGSILVRKNIVKSDKSGFAALRNFGGVSGSFDIYKINEFEKQGGLFSYNPIYISAKIDKSISRKTVEEAKKENLIKKEEAIRIQTQKKREKYIEAFNEKYERKRVKGENGAFSKYVIDRKTGDIVQFFRKDSLGRTMSGHISNKEPLLKTIDIVTPEKFVHKETTDMLTGKLVNKTTVTKDGKIKNDQYLVSKCGQVCYPNLPSEREKYIQRLLFGLV